MLAGCPTPEHPRPPDALTEPEAVLAAAAAIVAPIQSLMVEARVSYYGKDGAKKAKMVILARRPADLHFSALSPTDDLISVLAADGERFSSFERGAKVCYVGRACPRNIGRLLPIAMEGEEVFNVLAGGTPLINAHTTRLEWDGRAGAHRVDLVGDYGAEQSVWIEHPTGSVLRSVIRQGTLIVVDIAFEDFADVEGQRLPHVISIKMSRNDVDLKIKYREVDLNTDIADDAFTIPCPTAASEETLPCEDEPLPMAPGE